MTLFSLKERGITGWKKVLIILGMILIVFVIIVILAISPIAKYLIEKYDVKYTGREIKTGLVYLNPFTGFIRIGNLKVFEAGSDSIFFSAEGISLNFEITKMLRKTYEISSLTINKPSVVVIKNKNRFNFSDILEKQDTTAKKEENKEPAHINILDIKIRDGKFRYMELRTSVNYVISKFNLDSDGKYWDSDSINARFSFMPGKGPGMVKGDCWFDLKSNDFRLSSAAENINIDLFEQYLKDLANYGTVSAMFGFNIKAGGNFNEKKAIKLQGKILLNDLHFGKNPDEDYFSLEQFKVSITDLEPLNKKYFFDSVLIKKPFAIYEVYDQLSNIERMFGENGSNVKEVKADPEKFNLILELADYIKVLFRDILHSDYKVNYLSIEDGDFRFNDYSLTEKFSMAFQPFNIKADLIDKDNKKVVINLESGIKPYGSFSAEISMDPGNDKNYYIKYNFDKIPVTMFNPYTISYSSYPLDKGLIEMNGKWKIYGDSLKSTNHFIALDPRVSQRVRKKDTKWLPMPLIMSILRERGNVIDYKIPITGSLKDPKFHLSDVILDILKNIFLKPPTTPYGIEVRNIETKIEKSLTVSWPTRQTHLKEQEDKFAKKIADFLKDNKEASINVKPVTFEDKEKEYILFFEAKKKYYLANTKKSDDKLNDKDSVKIDKMSTRDSSFVKYLNSLVKDSMVFTRQEKCQRILDPQKIDNLYNHLIKDRRQTFMNYFKKNATEKQVNFLSNENVVPFDGFSYYKIDYKGDVPKSLEKAYKRLTEINTQPPRKKYTPLRKTEQTESGK